MILQNASININTAADNAVVAAVSGVQFRIHRIVLINAVATAQTVTVKDGAGGATLAVIPLPSAVGGSIYLGDDPAFAPLWLTSSGNAFVLNLSAATAVNGFVSYSAG